MLLSTEEISTILQKAIPSASKEEVRKASQEVVATIGQWKELDLTERLGAAYSCQCADICGVGEAYSQGKKIRVFISQ